MKPINILQFIYNKKNLQTTTFDVYAKLTWNYVNNNKPREIDDLKSFVKNLISSCKKNNRFLVCDGFYLNFKIKQISVEFDLLRFSENNVIDIELKNETDLEKIKNQLLRNQYYLTLIKPEVFSFTYCSDSNTLYQLENEELKIISFNELSKVLLKDEIISDINLNELFIPSKFLISPLNNTQQFLNGNYFLTEHQENIKKEILNDIENNNIKYFIIEGKPGIGKTLLIYDIAKTLINLSTYDNDLCIIHCGNLNDGHKQLTKEGFNIIRARESVFEVLTKKPKIILVDESQRFYPLQLEAIHTYCQKNDASCIFSLDPDQTLSKNEKNYNNKDTINNYENKKSFTLTKKIRINDELFSFITNLFDLSKCNENIIYKNVNINHFNCFETAKYYINFLQKKYNYYFINFTSNASYFPDPPYTILNNNNNKQNSHSVIGQEFDNVIVIIDSTFYYENKTLKSTGWDKVIYDPVKMLYQAITRVRMKLSIIIIDNITVFNECLKIINRSKS